MLLASAAPHWRHFEGSRSDQPGLPAVQRPQLAHLRARSWSALCANSLNDPSTHQRRKPGMSVVLWNSFATQRFTASPSVQYVVNR